MGEVKKVDIDRISKIIGIDSNEKTVVRLKDGDEDKKTLELVEGSWDNKHPWFLIDNDEYYAIMPAKALGSMFSQLRVHQEENFRLNLEKAILQNMPIDFDDVWVVAIREIQELSEKEGGKLNGVELGSIVKKIKEKHPNLFFHISDLLSLQKMKK